MKCCSNNGGVLVSLVASAAILSTSVIVSGMSSPADEISQVAHAAMADVITGDWEGEVSGDDLPEDMEIYVSLEMDEDFVVIGVFTVVEDGDAPFEGSFDPESNVLTGTVTVPDGPVWEMTLTLDEDELEGEATETYSGTTVDVSLERSEE